MRVALVATHRAGLGVLGIELGSAVPVVLDQRTVRVRRLIMNSFCAPGFFAQIVIA